MSLPLSRVMSAATAAYAVYALAQPRHLGAALSADPDVQQRYDPVATTYGCRDLAISAAGLFGRSPQTVRTAMLIRVALDLADGLVLSQKADTDDARTKVLAVTSGWGR